MSSKLSRHHICDQHAPKNYYQIILKHSSIALIKWLDDSLESYLSNRLELSAWLDLVDTLASWLTVVDTLGQWLLAVTTANTDTVDNETWTKING